MFLSISGKHQKRQIIDYFGSALFLNLTLFHDHIKFYKLVVIKILKSVKMSKK